MGITNRKRRRNQKGRAKREYCQTLITKALLLGYTIEPIDHSYYVVKPDGEFLSHPRSLAAPPWYLPPTMYFPVMWRAAWAALQDAGVIHRAAKPRGHPRAGQRKSG